MKPKTLQAHFDGEQIRLDEPLNLKPDTPLLVRVWPREAGSSEREEWSAFSAGNLAEAFGEDEPEYSMDLIKEPNPEYEGG